MSAANGMWYQRLSKLKIPLSSACFVVTAQLNTVIAITAAITHNAQTPSPVGDVVGGTAPCAVAGGGGSPAAAGPAGRALGPSAEAPLPPILAIGVPIGNVSPSFAKISCSVPATSAS